MEGREGEMQRTVKASVWQGKEQSRATQGIASIKLETYTNGAIFLETFKT